MTLKLRIRKIEERLERIGAVRKLQTICFLCESGMPTQDQADAALVEYQAKHPDWATQDLIEVRVNTRVLP